eukprot:1738898-Rhodomonas_salina.1
MLCVAVEGEGAPTEGAMQEALAAVEELIEALSSDPSTYALFPTSPCARLRKFCVCSVQCFRCMVVCYAVLSTREMTRRLCVQSEGGGTRARRPRRLSRRPSLSGHTHMSCLDSRTERSVRCRHGEESPIDSCLAALVLGFKCVCVAANPTQSLLSARAGSARAQLQGA